MRHFNSGQLTSGRPARRGSIERVSLRPAPPPPARPATPTPPQRGLTDGVVDHDLCRLSGPSVTPPPPPPTTTIKKTTGDGGRGLQNIKNDSGSEMLVEEMRRVKG